MFLGTPSYVVKTNGPFLEFLFLLFGFTLFCFYFRLLAFCLLTYNNLIHFIPGRGGGCFPSLSLSWDGRMLDLCGVCSLASLSLLPSLWNSL